MKTFLEFLAEMPKRIEISQDVYRDGTPDKFSDRYGARGFTSKKISKLPTGHNVYKVEPNYDTGSYHKPVQFVAVHPNGDIHATLSGHMGSDRFDVSWAERKKQSGFKMADFSHHLITKHNIRMVSDSEHSDGSISHWKDLSERPGIKMGRINRQGRKLKFHSGGNFRKNYGSTDNYLVAEKE